MGTKVNRGFTIIELLVVLIIIAVLSSIALPSFLSMLGRSRSSEAKFIVRELMREDHTHYMENNEFKSFDDVPTLDNYTLIVDTFNNHGNQDGSRVSGVRYRAVPSHESLEYVMGKQWIQEGQVHSVFCSAYADRPFMKSKVYCPD